MDEQKLVAAVLSALDPSLLKPEYRSRVEGGAHPVTGHCYAASEALYHLLGGKAEGWTPVNIRHEGGPHWFLRHQSGRILDVTAEQFQSPVPYAEGRGMGFLTKEPSRRAERIIERVRAESVKAPEKRRGRGR